MEGLLDTCLSEALCDEFTFYLTGQTNFRYRVYPEYKANRANTPKPKYLQECRDYLIKKYSAVVSDNCEADDLMAINQTNDTIICSLDKDMLQVPGRHFAWAISGGTADKRWEKPATLQTVSEFDGLLSFYTQMVTGDPSDNIKGIAGIGKVGAKKLLATCTTEDDLFNAVLEAYAFPDIMRMNAMVLWIMRKEGETFDQTRLGKVLALEMIANATN